LSTAVELCEPETRCDAPRAETLAASVVILLGMTVAQRLVGFGRGVIFCRWLPVEELGQWDAAFAFLNLAGPLVVLGLPGSFGRYVEHFRQRGQFHVFLRRTAVVTAPWPWRRWWCGATGSRGRFLGRRPSRRS
jgi:hypothetical protein